MDSLSVSTSAPTLTPPEAVTPPETATVAHVAPGVLVRWRGIWRRWIMSIVSWRVERVLLPIIGGPVFFQIARIACRLDLVGLLRRSPGLTFGQIRDELDLQEEPLSVLLSGCVSLKILRKRRERYYAGPPLRSRLLDPSHSPNLVPIIEWMHQIVAPSMLHLEQSLRESRPAGIQAFAGDEDNLYGRLSRDPERQDVFYEAMNARTRVVNDLFLDRIDFGGIRRMLDVGGGDGEVLAAIANRNPQLTGTLLEVSGVAERAQQRFVTAGLSGRLQSMSTEGFSEPFPGGHDFVLYAHVLANHPQEVNARFLRRAFDALQPGGLIGIYGAFMDDDQTGPLSSAMLSVYFFCTVSGGRHYSWAECENWLQETGFAEITRTRIAHNHGLILARKP